MNQNRLEAPPRTMALSRWLWLAACLVGVSGEVQTLTSKVELDGVLSANDVAFVKFFAPWCV